MCDKYDVQYIMFDATKLADRLIELFSCPMSKILKANGKAKSIDEYPAGI
jgi:hypothetical protein